MTDLFTLPELASYLQTDVDTATAMLARDIATGAVRLAAGQQLTAGTAVLDVVVDPWTTTIVLPQRPVTAVTSVQSYADDNVTLTAVPFTWRGSAGVKLTTAPWAEARMKVTYTAGSDDPMFLAVAKGVALAAAARLYANPTNERAETIGDYSHTTAVESLGTVLTDAEQRTLRARYGIAVASVPIRL